MVKMADHNNRVVNQFSQQAESDGRLTSRMVGDERQLAFRQFIGPKQEHLVLDVCCGPGALALDLAPDVTRTIGLDLAPRHAGPGQNRRDR